MDRNSLLAGEFPLDLLTTTDHSIISFRVFFFISVFNCTFWKLCICMPLANVRTMGMVFPIRCRYASLGTSKHRGEAATFYHRAAGGVMTSRCCFSRFAVNNNNTNAQTTQEAGGRQRSTRTIAVPDGRLSRRQRTTQRPSSLAPWHCQIANTGTSGFHSFIAPVVAL